MNNEEDINPNAVVMLRILNGDKKIQAHYSPELISDMQPLLSQFEYDKLIQCVLISIQKALN